MYAHNCINEHNYVHIKSVITQWLCKIHVFVVFFFKTVDVCMQDDDTLCVSKHISSLPVILEVLMN